MDGRPLVEAPPSQTRGSLRSQRVVPYRVDRPSSCPRTTTNHRAQQLQNQRAPSGSVSVLVQCGQTRPMRATHDAATIGETGARRIASR